MLLGMVATILKLMYEDVQWCYYLESHDDAQ